MTVRVSKSIGEALSVPFPTWPNDHFAQSIFSLSRVFLFFKNQYITVSISYSPTCVGRRPLVAQWLHNFSFYTSLLYFTRYICDQNQLGPVIVCGVHILFFFIYYYIALCLLRARQFFCLHLLRASCICWFNSLISSHKYILIWNDWPVYLFFFCWRHINLACCGVKSLMWT